MTMKPKYLFPANYKKVGWVVFIPSAILGLATLILEWEPEFLTMQVPVIFDLLSGGKHIFEMTNNNLLNEILGVLNIISALLVAFSKEGQEDEYISKIRLESLVWAVYVNYGILLVSFLFIYDMSFLWVMIFNMFTVLLFFIIRFNWQLLILKRAADHEE